MKSKLWKQFIEYGSGFDLEMERAEGNTYFHLKMYGLCYPEGYELVGEDIEELMEQAIKDGDENIKRLKKKFNTRK